MYSFSFVKVFTEEEERSLVNYITTSSKLFHGLSYCDVRRLAYEFVSKLEKKMPDSWEVNGQAGKDWIYAFMGRHQNLSLRSPEATSIARAQGFNKRSVVQISK